MLGVVHQLRPAPQFNFKSKWVEVSSEGITFFASEESDVPQAFFPLHTIKGITSIGLENSDYLLVKLRSDESIKEEHTLFQNLFEIEIDTSAFEDYLH